jgi:hypothetical protein
MRYYVLRYTLNATRNVFYGFGLLCPKNRKTIATAPSVKCKSTHRSQILTTLDIIAVVNATSYVVGANDLWYYLVFGISANTVIRPFHCSLLTSTVGMLGQ